MNTGSANKKDLGIERGLAKLIKAVSYPKDGITVLVPKGTTVFVDTIKGYAFYQDDHFDVFPDEYRWELLN